MTASDPGNPPAVRLVTAPPGGIMTDDVGAISGPVEVWLEGPAARIRYEGALETYTVTGAVLDRSLDEVLTVLTTDPGVDEFGNPRSTSLDPEALSRGD